MAATTLTAARLREILYYDPDTGVFTWHSTGRGRRLDRGAGNVTVHGYMHICIKQERYFAHRLAWLYVHGDWPADQIDHIDGDKLNNRISNLRAVTGETNRQNIHGPSSNCRSGYLGVSEMKNPNLVTRKWKAQISINGATCYLGTFDSPELAQAAYLGAKRAVHPGNTL